MTKSELIEALAVELKCSNGTASSIVSTILGAMTETLIKGENVEIRGFGSFSIRSYGSYTDKNPKTGEKTTVKAKKLPFFKVGKELREAVDKARLESK